MVLGLLLLALVCVELLGHLVFFSIEQKVVVMVYIELWNCGRNQSHNTRWLHRHLLALKRLARLQHIPRLYRRRIAGFHLPPDVKRLAPVEMRIHRRPCSICTRRLKIIGIILVNSIKLLTKQALHAHSYIGMLYKTREALLQLRSLNISCHGAQLLLIFFFFLLPFLLLRKQGFVFALIIHSSWSPWPGARDTQLHRVHVEQLGLLIVQ